MEIKPLSIEGAWLAKFQTHFDDRGSFREWFKLTEIQNKTGLHFEVRQSNVSKSRRGVIRGVHYSLAPKGQAKWVTCNSGKVVDLVVDLRPNSPTFKKYELIELNGEDGQAILIGYGLGHGFLSLEEGSILSYLLDSEYSPSEEFAVNPLDPDLGIKWPMELVDYMKANLSIKDEQAPSLFVLNSQKLLPSY